MKARIKALQLDDRSHQTVDVMLASSCPICGVALSPHVISAALIFDKEYDEYSNCYVLNHCSNCEECFISQHTYDDDYSIYEYSSSAPQNYFTQSFSDDITKLSPDFVAIYNDSLRAESLGMNSICGMGYRKALEFLVKDYAISNNPDDQDKITNMALAQCIEKYIDNNRIKSLAKASAWLGNDATHYIKKHPQYGTPQLKSFINALITFIDSDFAFLKAQSFISSN